MKNVLRYGREKTMKLFLTNYYYRKQIVSHSIHKLVLLILKFNCIDDERISFFIAYTN